MTTDKQKETPGQEEMPETGAELDESQQNQLEEFMSGIPSGSPEKEEEAETETLDEPTEEVIEDATTPQEEEDEGDEDDGEDEEEGADEGDEKTEEEVDEIVGLRAEIAENKKILARYAAEQQEKVEEEEKIEVKIDPATLITEDEAAEFLTDPYKVLSNLAEKIYTKAREDTLKDIPQLVASGARRQTALNDARKTFWTENEDLMAKAKKIPAVDRLIRMTANEVQSENPSWTVAQIFSETGKQVRAAISLNERAQQIESEVTRGKKKGSNQPTKPRGKRRSPGKGKADDRSGLQKQLDEMAESVS